MSNHSAKRQRVVIGTVSNGQGGVVEISATQRGVGNAQVQFRERFIRSVREAVHDAASQAHAMFNPGPKPQTLKKRKHYPKKPQQGGKKTRKMRGKKRHMTRKRK